MDEVNSSPGAFQNHLCREDEPHLVAELLQLELEHLLKAVVCNHCWDSQICKHPLFICSIPLKPRPRHL